jgi:cytochrome b subunit of formate dehydrogenase
MMENKTVRKIAAYLFFTVILLYIITGYGITQFRFVEKYTFGILTKTLSFKIHFNLIIPLIILALIHLCFSCSLFKGLRKWFQKQRK